MQFGIVGADTDGSAWRGGPLAGVVGASSMLRACIAPGCTTIVLGRGTCVAHDPPHPRLVDALLGEAGEVSRGPERDAGPSGAG